MQGNGPEPLVCETLNRVNKYWQEDEHLMPGLLNLGRRMVNCSLLVISFGY